MRGEQKVLPLEQFYHLFNTLSQQFCLLVEVGTRACHSLEHQSSRIKGVHSNGQPKQNVHQIFAFVIRVSYDLFHCSGIAEHEDNNFLGNNVQKKQRKFHPDLWGKAPVQEVSTLPCGNDGLAMYNMSAGNDQQANRIQINKNEEGTTTCGICGSKTEYVPCPERWYIQKGKKSIKVFYWGKHTCPVISKPEKRTKKVREMLEENPKVTQSKI